jgi:hypothetical protein
MKAKRAALLGLILCTVGATASAQLAPSLQGDIGLFTMPTADTPLAGHWTFGAYGWKEQLIAGDLALQNNDFRHRLYSHWAGEGSIGVGVTDNWTIFASAGAERYQSRGGGPAERSTASNLRPPGGRGPQDLGTKYSSSRRPARTSGSASGWPPASRSSHTTVEKGESGPDLNHIKSRRTDWEWARS